MNLLILSDLHNEFSEFSPTAGGDVVVLAGDIDIGHLGLPWARRVWGTSEIIYVPGNHEYYGQDFDRVGQQLRQAAAMSGVRLLDGDETIINGVRFLGATLWTDFALFGQDRCAECMDVARRRLNDFHLIHYRGRLLRPEDVLQLHRKQLAWLERKLKQEPFAGETVVVTHHTPSMKSVAERYQDDLLSACFSSNLDHLFGHSKLWIHGHTHDSFDYEVRGTRVICNPRGYSGRAGSQNENRNFKSSLAVDV